MTATFSVRGTGVWANAAERRSPMTADGTQTPLTFAPDYR